MERRIFLQTEKICKCTEKPAQPQAAAQKGRRAAAGTAGADAIPAESSNNAAIGETKAEGRPKRVKIAWTAAISTEKKAMNAQR